MTTIETERRRAPRARFAGAVILNTPGRELTCVAGNLSEAGMLIFPPGDASPSIGLPVQVRFTLPRLYQWLACPATVVREASLDRRRGWGVAFDQLSPEIKRAIRTFVVVGHGQVIEYCEGVTN